MLLLNLENCCKCRRSAENTVQEATMNCKKCKSTFIMCKFCKKEGCLNCKGELESQMDFAEKHGLMF